MFLVNDDLLYIMNRNDIGQTALHVAIQGGHRMTSDHILKTVKSLAGVKDNNKVVVLRY